MSYKNGVYKKCAYAFGGMIKISILSYLIPAPRTSYRFCLFFLSTCIIIKLLLTLTTTFMSLLTLNECIHATNADQDQPNHPWRLCSGRSSVSTYIEIFPENYEWFCPNWKIDKFILQVEGKKIFLCDNVSVIFICTLVILIWILVVLRMGFKCKEI
jgi:hypothetical protein